MIKKVIKKLPLISSLLQYLLRRYYSAAPVNRKMANHLACYFGLSTKEVISLLRVSSYLNKELWHILNPQSEEEILKFYSVNPFYIFSLAYWHMSRGQKIFRSTIVRISQGDVLDYGGGIGDLSVALARAGRKVFYVDVNGKTYEFARWLIAQHEISNVTMMQVPADWEEIWTKKYSTIVCLDVIEHLKDPEIVLGHMAQSLAVGGSLIITGLNCAEKNEDHPMHFKIDFDPITVLNSYGLYPSKKYEWLWVKD